MTQRINSRTKGATAELEAARWLQSTFRLEHTPQRNLEQVRSGGHDLLGFPPFYVEVKRQEILNLRGWWQQALNAARNSEDDDAEPVVMYRQNRGPWLFLISARHLNMSQDAGLKLGYLHIKQNVFIPWAKSRLNVCARQFLDLPEAHILQRQDHILELSGFPSRSTVPAHLRDP